jgi:hypothetical protein
MPVVSLTEAVVPTSHVAQVVKIWRQYPVYAANRGFPPSHQFERTHHISFTSYYMKSGDATAG